MPNGTHEHLCTSDDSIGAFDLEGGAKVGSDVIVIVKASDVMLAVAE
jgi:molybdopterin-binding protein